ncbi:MAG TPA: hypothetical protein EYN06_03155 [Myxococcales bacterium]|nr:hypothetical protein [Myxococcales bacterium]HIN85454.1 hypothetical protein [Myxococcales bacterium]
MNTIRPLIILLTTLTLANAPQLAAAQTSAQLRAQQKHSITAGLGFVPLAGAGGILTYGFSVNQELEIQLAAQLLASAFPASWISGSVNLKARYYLGNAFYLSAGLGMEKGTIKDTFILPNNKVDVIKSETQYSAFGLDFGVGQQWRWGSFILDLEYVGVHSPLVFLNPRSVGVDKQTGKEVSNVPDNMEVDDLPFPVELRFVMLSVGGAF